MATQDNRLAVERLLSVAISATLLYLMWRQIGGGALRPRLLRSATNASYWVSLQTRRAAISLERAYLESVST